MACHSPEFRRSPASKTLAPPTSCAGLSPNIERLLRALDILSYATLRACGFCAECGSSLFWDAPANDTVSVAAGSLDEPTRLHLLGHVYVAQAGDYYELPEDGLPRREGLV